MHDEVVHRLVDRRAARKRLELIAQQLHVHHIWMVPVELLALVEREMSQVAVYASMLTDATEISVSSSATLRATVDFPEPEPPATPTINDGIACSLGKDVRKYACE